MSELPLTSELLLTEVIAFYAASPDANGLPVRWVIEHFNVPAAVVETHVRALASEAAIEVVFAEVEENPHIRRLPRAWRGPVEELLEQYDIRDACLYPMPRAIQQHVDLSKWKEHPYTLRLWQGASHLDQVFFDLAVLERYRNDPRYRYVQRFFGGQICIKSEHYLSGDFPERDKVLVERFGIGYDERGLRVVAVTLRDLRHLSFEHQKAWASFERFDPCKLNEATFKSCYWGSWSEFGSIFEAVPAELAVINQMTQAAFGRPLFREDFTNKYPPAYDVLLRPTQKEFLDFACALDLLLSENINRDFFPDTISRTYLEPRKDGAPVEKQKGTMQMLEEWIRQSYRPKDGDPAAEICAAMRRVRKARSVASHTNVEDVFDAAFEKRQRDLITDAYAAVQTIRLIMANHPKARQVKVPEWLFDSEIRIP
jgi:hypothetical protein